MTQGAAPKTEAVLASPRSSCTPQTDLKLPAVFGSGMVLQRDTAAPIWGWASPGETVTVTLGNESHTATAGQDGKWMVKLSPRPAGGPFDITVAGKKVITLRDVLFGDVWLCSGQSNMEFELHQGNDQDEIAASDYPQIRLFTVSQESALEPKSDCKGEWAVCSPKTSQSFSSVGYFFGRDLHRALKVPIGLINASVGGSRAEAWTARPVLDSDPDYAPFFEWHQYCIDSYRKTMLANKKRLAGMAQQPGATPLWHSDPGDTGHAKGWARQDSDLSGWRPIELPDYWHAVVCETFNGAVWFRKEIDIPADLAGQEALLSLGPIEDFDTVWFNNEPVGSTGADTPDFWLARRCYSIPAALVKPGRNVIAVRVFSRFGNGGFSGAPGDMSLIARARGGQSDTKIALAGPWFCRVEIKLAPHTIAGPYGPGQGNPYDYGAYNGPAFHYNAMISPLVPLALKGAIWYQGEANVGCAYVHRKLLPAMIQGWRAPWGRGDFPFLIVQLANYGEAKSQPESSQWAELREAQLMTARTVPASGLAVTIDIGQAEDIHPINKRDVGARLALVARAVAYGQTLVSSGPLYQRMTVEGNKVRLRFSDIGSGLLSKGGTLKGFSIAASDQRFVWADAFIDGDTIVVSSSGITAPVAVRYAWAGNPEGCNLYNKEGLPASPFRTDDWPGVTINNR